MYSSGTTAVATSGAGSVPLITVPAGASYNFLCVNNEGANPGFFSTDGGNTWGRISAATTATYAVGKSSKTVLIKRDGSSDMASVYGYCDWVGKY